MRFFFSLNLFNVRAHQTQNRMKQNSTQKRKIYVNVKRNSYGIIRMKKKRKKKVNKNEAHTLRGQSLSICHPLPLSTQEKLKLCYTVSVRRRPSPKNERYNILQQHTYTDEHSDIHNWSRSFVLFHWPVLLLYCHELVREKRKKIGRQATTAAHSTNSILVIKTNKANDGVQL